LLYFVRLGTLGFGGMIALAFVQGVTAAAVGAIAGAAVILGKRSLVDIPTSMIGLITFVVLVKLRKVPEPVLILIAGVIGLLQHHGNP
jgi:chromate transporter